LREDFSQIGGDHCFLSLRHCKVAAEAARSTSVIWRTRRVNGSFLLEISRRIKHHVHGATFDAIGYQFYA
jgi:hypothetical protein